MIRKKYIYIYIGYDHATFPEECQNQLFMIMRIINRTMT